MRVGKADFEYKGARASARLDLDGSGRVDLRSGSAFLDHMLSALSKTGGLDLEVKAEGSSYYWTVALGGALGLAVSNALGDRAGVRRYGSAAVPMDESFAQVALDLSGRAYMIMRGSFAGEQIGDMGSQEMKAFLEMLANEGRLTLHISFYGENDHHKAEGIFKALGLAVREAAAKEGLGVPSTKGVL